MGVFQWRMEETGVAECLELRHGTATVVDFPVRLCGGKSKHAAGSRVVAGEALSATGIAPNLDADTLRSFHRDVFVQSGG